MPTVMNVVGARPQFVKAGPVSKALAGADVIEILVDTGQHYDELMSNSIMVDVGLRTPDFDLGIGSGSHGKQTGLMLEAIESLILKTKPDAVLTYGDTNSTIAAALAATKLHILTAHVEAGLRSFNRAMPEELNRVATDHISDLLYAPTQVAMDHLANEGLADRSVLTGDVMVDALLSIDLDSVALPNWADGDFYVATIHRPSNTDDPIRLQAILESLASVHLPTYLLAHPRLRDRLNPHMKDGQGSLHIGPPLPYGQMLAALRQSKGLITDSGGLQKEAFVLGIPCTTIREETEWPETLEGSWNILAGSRLGELADLVSRTPSGKASKPFGNGEAATKIVAGLLPRLQP